MKGTKGSERREAPKTTASSGTARIAAAFASARAGKRAALMPYVTAGYPTLASLGPQLRAAGRAGADLVEVGVPFSDPLADGPIVQQAAEEALRGGYRLGELFSAIREVARDAPPLVLLTYINPVLAYGAERFLEEARDAGVTGLIVPDLPLVESGALGRAAARRDLVLVPMAAPTSTDAHLAAVAEGPGFVYGVSVTGVTGVRERLDPEVLAFADRLKAKIRRPVAIGFGISTPNQAREVGARADGVIIGSALVRAIGQRLSCPEAAVEEFVARIRQAMEPDDATPTRSVFDNRRIAAGEEGPER